MFTQDVSRAFTLAKLLDVGGVIVNGSTAIRAENLPFGGTKDTGGYREGLHETVLDFTPPEDRAGRWRPSDEP